MEIVRTGTSGFMDMNHILSTSNIASQPVADFHNFCSSIRLTRVH